MTQPLEENLDEFTTSYRREIIFYLRQLIEHGERISVVFNEGRETFLTVLLDVDEDHDTLIFDYGGSDRANRIFLNSERSFFVCAPHGIRHQFLTGRAWETMFQGRRAFATTLPAKFVRLQRRQFFRLVLPMSRRLPCSFRTGSEGQRTQAVVLDIGLGGVGMEVPVTLLPSFTAGQILTKATIDLPDYGSLWTDLEVRYATAVQRGNKEVGRIGCRFVGLLPAQEHLLQKFIIHVQREERNRLAA